MQGKGQNGVLLVVVRSSIQNSTVYIGCIFYLLFGIQGDYRGLSQCGCRQQKSDSWDNFLFPMCGRFRQGSMTGSRKCKKGYLRDNDWKGYKNDSALDKYWHLLFVLSRSLGQLPFPEITRPLRYLHFHAVNHLMYCVWLLYCVWYSAWCATRFLDRLL